MEKFAVDLDKVLDELEFNEDRAENLMTAAGRHPISSVSSLQENSVVHVPFESGDNSSKWRPKPVPVTQKTSVSGVFSSLNEYLNSGRAKPTPIVSDINHAGQCTTDEPEIENPQPPAWSPPRNEVISLEEKPDLIDSTVLCPNVLVVTNETVAVEERRNSHGTFLPDIATAGTTLSTTSHDDASSSLDLLSRKNNTIDLNSGEEAKSEMPPLNSVLSFGSLDVSQEINDDELSEYLSDLELEEKEEEENLKEVSCSRSPSLLHDEVKIESEQPKQYIEVDIRKESQHGNLCLESDSALMNEPSMNVTSMLQPEPPQTSAKNSSHSLLESETSSAILNYENSSPEQETKQPHSWSEPPTCEATEEAQGDSTVASLIQSEEVGTEISETSGLLQENLSEVSISQSAVLQTSVIEDQTFTNQDDIVSGDNFSTPICQLTSDENIPGLVLSSGSARLEGKDCATNVLKIEEDGDLKLGTILQHQQEKIVPLTVCVNETIDTSSELSSPTTPPTVPVTPTFQDAPVVEEIASNLSTPFLTPTAVCESSIFNENNDLEDPVTNLPETTTPDVDALTKTVVCDTSQKPVRPSSLEIPVCIEPSQAETTGSSEESLAAFNATIGPPGATPSASRPSIGETLSEPQVTDDSATESSVEEGLCGAVGGVETSDPVLVEETLLGKEPPFWVPDADAPCCMQCDFKFTVLKRRHHCRACGKVLCSKCCSEKAHLEYINAEARVCVSCKSILTKAVGSSVSLERTNLHPNPNNPMEYCSTVPPLLQVTGSSASAPSVMVPVGVLKREGSTKPKSEAKQVMFSDGIRPGADLAELDGSTEPRLSIRRTGRVSKRVGTPPGNAPTSHRSLPAIDATTMSYVPHGKGLPPIVIRGKDGIQFEENPDPARLMALIREDSVPPVKFTINRNLYVLVKILDLNCCVNKVCWCFTSDGLSSVGQDEIVIILEVEPEETNVPKDIFIHLNTLYMEAAKGNTVTEMGHTLTQGSPFLGSREHGGFLYVRPTFQCLHRLILPPAPYLVGVLIHKWETPWARIFPIRLMLRLGAEFRYYPCSLVSIRQRSAVYGEIGHTIIQMLADFRNMAYTLPTVRGLLIHMEDKQTMILLPRNRYDQVMRALNNSNDHFLAFGANFSQVADSHLVCMQTDTEHSYYTQAINIQNKPRKVTGASFVVFNGALKVSCGMAAKSSIVEDGLMVKVTAETMATLKTSLRDMKDLTITCGPINPTTESSAGAGALPSDEVVLVKWAEDDRSFNIGVLSSVDGRPLNGVPSIRVHNGTDYHGEYRFIRWTEVFILESEEGSGRTGDPVDISRLSEQLAKATCLALVKLLDLLAAANLTTLAVRATIHPENVGYLAGSNGEKLPPIYMNSLDHELVPVLHEAGLMSGESPAVLELVFRIMESG